MGGSQKRVKYRLATIRGPRLDHEPIAQSSRRRFVYVDQLDNSFFNSQLIRRTRMPSTSAPIPMLAMPVLRRHVVILAAHSSAENREEIARRLVDEATIGVALLVAMSDEDLRCRSNVGVRECKRLPQFRLIERGSAQVLIFGRVATPLAESKFSNSVFREPRCSRGECLVSIPPRDRKSVV